MAVYQSRAAERTLWKEEFTNPAKVAANGGVLTGAPTVDHGLELDGTTQLVGYPAAFLGGRQEINIIIEFKPNFAWNEDVRRHLVGSTVGQEYSVERRAAGVGSPLVIYLGNFVVGITSAAYSPYWRQDEINALVISSDGVTIDVWLNAFQVATAVALAWTPKYPTDLYIGAHSPGGGRFFDGTIYSVDFRAGLLTQSDVTAML